MIKAVFFDLDGTLLDTSRDLGRALNHTLEAEGKTPLPDEVTRKEVSNGANALIRLGFGELPPEEHQRLRQMLLEAYLGNIAEHTYPFDGIAELIAQISDNEMLWGIVTNKPLLYTEALMPHFQFASEPIATICPEHVTVSKPDPEGLLLAARQAQVSPDQVIYVGDHHRDIAAGINAGMKTIAVGYGFTETPHCHKRWNADFAVDHATEIWPIIHDLR